MKKGNFLLSAAATTALLSAGAHAAISIDSTIIGNNRLAFGAQTHVIATGLDASSSDKIVIAVATEHNFGGTSKPSLPTITFGGVDFALASSNTSDASGRVSLFYFDNPGTGDLVYSETGGSNGSAWTVFFLSGTAPGVGNTSSSATDSTSVATTADNSIVISALYADGPTVTGTPIPDPTADAPQIPVSNEAWNPGREYGILATAYQMGGPSGSTATASWTNPNTPTYTSASALAEFTAIPEPSCAALLGLAGLGLLRRRRN